MQFSFKTIIVIEILYYLHLARLLIYVYKNLKENLRLSIFLLFLLLKLPHYCGYFALFLLYVNKIKIKKQLKCEIHFNFFNVMKLFLLNSRMSI